MADALKLTPHQASDAAAASASVYAEAADEVLDRRTLGRDMLALLVIFMVVIIHHVQHPLLLHELQFGRAWRSGSLQPVIALALAVAALALVTPVRETFNHRLKRVAAAALGVYVLYALVVVVLRWHPLGALLGIEQIIFYDRPGDNLPLEALAAAYTISTVLEWVAIIATVALWQPWTRLTVYRRALRSQFAPLVVAVIVIAAWELLINIFQIQQFLLPRPSVIGATFLDTYPRLVSAGWNTFQNAFWGFVLGCGAGILTGFAAARFTSFSRALLPVAIAINAVPIIALAPIFNNWFGALNPASKIAIVAVLVYFPAMISTVRGLTSVDVVSLELMKSYAAGQWDIFRKLRLPTALPFIFSSLKVATTLSMIGAIVSEYFGGSTAGLGYRIRDDAGLFKYPEAWSAIFIASLIGILFYLVVSAVERALMSWHVSFREK